MSQYFELCKWTFGSLIPFALAGCDAGAAGGRIGDAGVFNQGGQATEGGVPAIGGSLSGYTGGSSNVIATGGSSNVINAGGTPNTGGTTSAPASTGGAPTGGAKPTGGAAPTGGSKPTGGAPATGGSSSSVTGCSGVSVPTTTSGKMTVAANGYAQSYYTNAAGFAYTWVGGDSITPATCIVPSCGGDTCTPSFGSTAVCAAGKVPGDSTYKSVVGFGFNLKQTNVQGSSASLVSAPSYITFYYSKSTETHPLRLQIGDGAQSWCFDTKDINYSGQSIPISDFNTTCWDNKGSYLSSGTPIQTVELVIPSQSATSVTFGDCLLDIALD
jgi:hypothetical protein